ncbi:MAG: hypothetical protein TE42_05020 [Candidatus Synechococcus spongiarum SP3]|uniref:Uncharacterized protein n=1 Tax=Candidatus Synechococcus spongiarum SP3 TaxID=1604020 RepID=A0A0G2HM63_9SYNE|nr:MAG: hypothetical protein TE42_05020 [Candidatus Synechococcus spongiarum SP3]
MVGFPVAHSTTGNVIQVASLMLGFRLALLMGENGSGETTILDAIVLTLGAVLSYLRDRDVKGISFGIGSLGLSVVKRGIPWWSERMVQGAPLGFSSPCQAWTRQGWNMDDEKTNRLGC